MHARLNGGLKSCMLANLLFAAFCIICLIFYKTYKADSALSNTLEFLAYLTEFSGFAIFIWGDWLISSSVRFRGIMKFAMTFYILLEGVMMILELNSYRLDFYKPYSLLLAIVHSILSGMVCLSFIQLDTDKKKLEFSLLTCIAIIFGGMLGNIMGLRIYFSIMINSVAFSLMFFLILHLIKREDIEVDCHGDKARVAEYKSTFIDD